MAYTKQTFTAGQTLKASDLNTMSQGIVDKQEKLVSGTSIKTINGQSLLGSGNITVQGGNTIIESGTLGAKYAGLYGKNVSFLGDSITTYSGYIPSGYATFYPRFTVNSVDKTWWKQFTQTCGMNILVNASWSGSTVSSKRNNSSSANTSSAAMGASTKRISDLAKDGVTPDVVICFIGANDFADNVPLGSWNGGELPAEGVINTFSEAYALMVSKIMKTYPNAEVFVCTILEATGSYNSMDDVNTGTYPMAFTGTDGKVVTLHDYNQRIRLIAEALGANVIDLHACGLTYFNASTTLGDTLHPNAIGAAMMAKKALSELYSKSIYMHPLGEASKPADAYYTVTYKYVDTGGATISPDTTKRVLSGTIISLTTANAPNIMGFTPKSVSPTSVTVSKNTTITFTYEADAETVFHTVTYKYVNSEGIAIKDPTTQRVVEGSSINLTTGLAPSVDGYRVFSVSPSGTQTISGNLTVTFTYNAVVYHTVTYNYVDGEGHVVKESTTEQVESGTSITLNTSTAPIISGYNCTAVSPSGTIIVSENVTITCTYKAVPSTWYVENADKTSRSAGANPAYAGFAYTNSETINACVGVPINAIRMYVHTAGVMSYGKCSSSSYEKLGELTLSNPSNTEAQTYTIPEVTLNDGERLWFGATSDNGLFYYGKRQSSNALGYFITGIKSSAPAGGARANENLSIDIGYVR